MVRLAHVKCKLQISHNSTQKHALTMMHLSTLLLLALCTSTTQAALRGQHNNKSPPRDETNLRRRRAMKNKNPSGQVKTDGGGDLDCLGKNTKVLDMWGLSQFAPTLCDEADIKDDESLCFNPALLGGIPAAQKRCSAHSDCNTGEQCLMIPLENSSGSFYGQQTKCSTIEEIISTEYSVVISQLVPKPLCAENIGV